MLGSSWLDGLLPPMALAESADCLKNDLSVLQSLSQILRRRLYLTLAEIKLAYGKRWPNTHSFQQGWLACRSCIGEHLQLLQNASATGLSGLLQAIWVCLCVYIYVVSVCLPTCPFYLAVSGRLTCGGWGKRYWSCYYYHLPWQLLTSTQASYLFF